jgi:hypothetical protein
VSTLDDFFLDGTQPETLTTDILHATMCITCHGINQEEIHIANNWQGSMMGQAARDPLFYACLTIANQDIGQSGDLCIRCHTPRGWLAGRSEPTDGSALQDFDRDGVNCNTCHRMVDPVYKPGISPVEDVDILNALAALPVNPGSGNYIIDPLDRRRGPFDDAVPPAPGHGDAPDGFLFSPYHQTSELCATCHDVSNPYYERQLDGTYWASGADYASAHTTGDKYDMFPIERTYSEWLMSDYPDGVDTKGRFGGSLPGSVVFSCQDCHMPDTPSKGCVEAFDPPMRNNLPAHDFAGGNTWVRDAIPDLFPGDMFYISTDNLEAGQARSIEMLQLAASIELTQDGGDLNVRITNETGHKLPTGYPEGRRMWLNVKFYDDMDMLIDERGFYDSIMADLATEDTKVYEAKLGLDAAAATKLGMPEGESFHFVLNNTYIKDNRIPPRGFTVAEFESVQAAPVAADYADGQYWDDTLYDIPSEAASATVTLYYQTSSKEYVEFLRDENVTDDRGLDLYNAWLAHGMSAPVEMLTDTIDIAYFADGDSDGDGDVDLVDFACFQLCFSGPGGGLAEGCESFDFDGDNDVDLVDFGVFQLVFTGPGG